MKELHGLTKRMILIEAQTSWRYSDLEDLHDTACAVVQRCARILSERAQCKFRL